MAQRYNYYSIVGDNGYGMSPDFSDIIQAAKYLRNEWHRGFQTEDEAYEYIKEQTMFRYALRSAGICDIDTLLAQKIVLLDEPVASRTTVDTIRQAGGRYNRSYQDVRRPVRSRSSLDDCLAEDEEEDTPASSHPDSKDKGELYKVFEAWYNDYVKNTKAGK